MLSLISRKFLTHPYWYLLAPMSHTIRFSPSPMTHNQPINFEPLRKEETVHILTWIFSHLISPFCAKIIISRSLLKAVLTFHALPTLIYQKLICFWHFICHQSQKQISHSTNFLKFFASSSNFLLFYFIDVIKCF